MEILATIPVYTYPWFYNLFWAIGAVVIIMGIVSITSTAEVNSIIPFFIGLVLIISGIIGIIHTDKAIDNTSVFDYNKYKVIIDDSVSAKEFLNEYEVLSREGEIFTIKEIEVDEE